MNTRKVVSPFIIVCFVFTLFASVCAAQVIDVNELLTDIPEPPGARSELPTPVPMVYEFMGAMMAGEFDICLANFEVQTFLGGIFSEQIKRLNAEDYGELYSYQIQSHRNEFRFLSAVMNKVAKGAKITYSDPRYRNKTQAKINVTLDTNRGIFTFSVYCRYTKGRWYVFDYIMNNQRLIDVYRNSLRNVGINRYIAFLRPIYGPQRGYRPVRNQKYDFSIQVPSTYKIKENVSEALLASVTGFNGQFLLHIQGAEYDEPQTLAQVGVAMKDSLMSFSPRLYNQWKSELAGIEIGHIQFNFKRGDRTLYAHMVLIPLGRKLVVLNFYHSSLELLKHLTNIREKIMESLVLPKVEKAGGLLPGENLDDLSLSSGDFGDIDSYSPPEFEDSSDVTINESPDSSYDSGVNEEEFDDGSTSELPPPDGSDDTLLTPDSYTEEIDYPDTGSEEPDFYDDEEIPPPPGSYGDGSSYTTDDEYYQSESEVSF